MDDVEKSRETIEEIIEREVEINNGNENRVFIGGISQGSALSLYSGLQSKYNLGGIIGLCGWVLPGIKSNSKVFEKSKMLFTHGKNDRLVPIEVAEEGYQKLGLLGKANFEYIAIENVGHCVTIESMEAIEKFWKDVMRNWSDFEKEI